MAITVSAYSVSDKYTTAINRYAEDLGNWVPQFEAIAEISAENAGAKQVYNDYPVGQIGAHDTTTITQMSHGAGATVSSITPNAYSARYLFTEIEESRDPGLVLRGAEKLLQGVKRTFESLVFSALPSGMDTTQVNTGHSAAARYIFSATHGYGSGSAVQSNLGTSALSQTSLNSARVAMRKWKGQSGEPLEMDRGPLALVVPPELGDTARRLVGSPQYAVTYSDNTISTSGADVALASAGAIGTSGSSINPHFGRAFTVIESAYLSDENNWYLINQENTPLNIWIPTTPSISVDRDPANRNWVVSVLFEAKVYWRAPVSGCFGANVS
tara:strand:+ start:750 stop:1733 length:984 start_codon:yes stop_codon:yes gene_type:complete